LEANDERFYKQALTGSDLAYQEIEKLNFPPELDDEEFIE
jgi:hypothetical protein